MAAAWNLEAAAHKVFCSSCARTLKRYFVSLGLQQTHLLTVRHFEAERILKVLLKGTDHPLTERVTESFSVPVSHGQPNIVLHPIVSSASQWGLLG